MDAIGQHRSTRTPRSQFCGLRLSTRSVNQSLADVPTDPSARERRRRQVATRCGTKSFEPNTGSLRIFNWLDPLTGLPLTWPAGRRVPHRLDRSGVLWLTVCRAFRPAEGRVPPGAATELSRYRLVRTRLLVLLQGAG